MDILPIINSTPNERGKEINREKLHNLVGLIYSPTYKTFYVNSLDGMSFVKPYGIFVSLGITTSKRTLEEVRQQIAAHGYDTAIAEISSIKDEESGQYLNTLMGVKDPVQYPVTDYDPGSVFNKEAAESELERLKALLTIDQDMETLKLAALKVSKLTDLIAKLNTGGWTNHYIQTEGNSYRIFHRYVNYKREGDVEYRIGIFVS